MREYYTYYATFGKNGVSLLFEPLTFTVFIYFITGILACLLLGRQLGSSDWRLCSYLSLLVDT